MQLKTKRPNASTLVADGLRSSILKGELLPGARVLQEAIAEQYQVSQSIVREAFKHLEMEGFLRADPKRGVSVAELTAEDAAELVRLRGAIEVQALRIAVPRMTEQSIAAARSALAELEAATTADDVIRWNAVFHDCLYAPSQQPRTLVLINLLRLSFDRYFRLVFDETSHVSRTQSEHRELLELCASRKAEEACDLLVRHVVGTGDALAQRLGESL